jgi:hypothetical protein
MVRRMRKSRRCVMTLASVVCSTVQLVLAATQGNPWFVNHLALFEADPTD